MSLVPPTKVGQLQKTLHAKAKESPNYRFYALYDKAYRADVLWHAYHPHVHMLITGGGITTDGEDWEPARGDFLVPVAVLSKKIAAKFRDALKKQKPDLFASIPAAVWRREWVSLLKHYGHGNDAVLNYLSRYVFRTAISNARILAVDQTHVTFRYKDRGTDTWRTMRIEGVEFLRRFLQHVLPRGFHKVRYYGLWHASKRHLASRAWLLLILRKPTDTAGPPKIADLLEALGQLTELIEQPLDGPDNPCCPYCGIWRIGMCRARIAEIFSVDSLISI